MKLIMAWLAAATAVSTQLPEMKKKPCCLKYRVTDERSAAKFFGVYENIGKHENRPLFKNEEPFFGVNFHLYFNIEADLWQFAQLIIEDLDLNVDPLSAPSASACPNLGTWTDKLNESITVTCEEPPVSTTPAPGTRSTRPGPTKPGPTKPGPINRMCCTSYDIVDTRKDTSMIVMSGTYELVEDEKINNRPMYKNVDEYADSGYFFHIWFSADLETWQVGDATGNFDVATIAAPEPSQCPFGGFWQPGLEVVCSGRRPTPTPKPQHECCKRYGVEGDNWAGIYLFKGMMNEAPIYINPDQMFGVTKHLYLCKECNKWVFGYSTDPADTDTLIATSDAKCPNEADFGGLKVTCLEDEERPQPETCELAAQNQTCGDIGNKCNMKVLQFTDGTNDGSRATITCRQHYRMNLPYAADPFVYDKQTTYAYCKCVESLCSWQFSKGAVQCTQCPVEQLQARNGKKQHFIEWETGIAIYYPIKVDARATDGWHVALDFNAEIGNFTRPDEIVDVDIVDFDKDKDRKPGPDKVSLLLELHSNISYVT